MLHVEQHQDQRVRPRKTEGSRVGAVNRDLHALKPEDRIETDDAGRQYDQEDHPPSRVLVHVLQEQVKRHRGEHEKHAIQQMRDDSQTDKSRVSGNVPSRRRCVAGHVHPGIDKSFGKAAEDPHEQVKGTGDSREAL
jgi:hypothetical protein